MGLHVSKRGVDHGEAKSLGLKRPRSRAHDLEDMQAESQTPHHPANNQQEEHEHPSSQHRVSAALPHHLVPALSSLHENLDSLQHELDIVEHELHKEGHQFEVKGGDEQHAALIDERASHCLAMATLQRELERERRLRRRAEKAREHGLQRRSSSERSRSERSSSGEQSSSGSWSEDKEASWRVSAQKLERALAKERKQREAAETSLAEFIKSVQHDNQLEALHQELRGVRASFQEREQRRIAQDKDRERQFDQAIALKDAKINKLRAENSALHESVAALKAQAHNSNQPQSRRHTLQAVQRPHVAAERRHQEPPNEHPGFARPTQPLQLVQPVQAGVEEEDTEQRLLRQKELLKQRIMSLKGEQ